MRGPCCVQLETTNQFPPRDRSRDTNPGSRGAMCKPSYTWRWDCRLTACTRSPALYTAMWCVVVYSCNCWSVERVDENRMGLNKFGISWQNISGIDYEAWTVQGWMHFRVDKVSVECDNAVLKNHKRLNLISEKMAWWERSNEYCTKEYLVILDLIAARLE